MELKDAADGSPLGEGLIAAGEDEAKLTLQVPPAGGQDAVNLTLEGRATIGGRAVSRLAVPAEDMTRHSNTGTWCRPRSCGRRWWGVLCSSLR